jgi:glucosamine--fructose-6-phosphate aminotransferase (isomerizing)
METTENSSHTYQEIISQPQIWQAVLSKCREWSKGLSGLWKPEADHEVIFTGCGSPYYLSQTAAAIFQGMTGRTGRAYPASEILIFPDLTLAIGKTRLLVALSRSGETTELIRAIEGFRFRDGGPVVGITCADGSSLLRVAPNSFVAPEAAEISFTQTRTFSSMLLAAQCLISVLAGVPLPERFFELPGLGEGLLRQHLPLARRLGTDPALDRFFFLGNGPFFGLACEAMLKMKETSLSYSEAYHFLEFRHGPMAMVDSNTLVVGLLSETGLNHEAAVLGDMRALGAKVLAITPVELGQEQADEQVVLPGGLNDLERSALYLPILQLLALFHALKKGLDPDKPANLKKFISLEIGPM